MFSVMEWKRGELGFVVVVLAVIFGVSFYQVKLGEMKTRDAQRKSDVEMVARGLKQFAVDHYGVYPPVATGEGKIVSCGGVGDLVCEWFTGPVVDEEGVVYINKLPDDPLRDSGYRYMYKPAEDRKSLRIYIGLENSRDKAYRSDLDEWCGEGIRCRWYVE